MGEFRPKRMVETYSPVQNPVKLSSGQGVKGRPYTMIFGEGESLAYGKMNAPLGSAMQGPWCMSCGSLALYVAVWTPMPRTRANCWIIRSAGQQQAEHPI
jgi:hypothetical protein